MEKHCVSLEIAKKLKETDWKKETEFWWTNRYITREARKDDTFDLIDVNTKIIYPGEELYPAPLATEILEELPHIEIYYNNLRVYEVKYADCRSNYQIIKDESLPNALAKMWLYLTSKGEL